MKTVDIPQNFVGIAVQRWDRIIEAHEFTVRHRLRIMKDPDYDTPMNALLDTTDLSMDEIEDLTERELDMFYDAVIENSYPGVREKLASGEMETPTKKDVTESKKNS